MLALSRRKITLPRKFIRQIISLAIKHKLSQGGYVKKFEERFAAYIGVNNAITVSSGTAALALILETLVLNKGDEIILPAYTFPSIPSCIKALGFLPRFVDIDPRDDNLDISEIKKILNNKTKVIIATHIFGKPCNIMGILELAKERGIFVIEDCAHAIGSEYDGRKLGSFGDASFFSFSLTKPFNTFNGGMIVCNDHVLAGNIRAKTEKLPALAKFKLLRNIAVAYFLEFLTKPVIFTISIYPVLLMLSFMNKDLISLYEKSFKKLIFLELKRSKFSNLQAVAGLRVLDHYEFIKKERIKKISLFNELCRKYQLKRLVCEDNKINTIFPYFYVIKSSYKDMIVKELLRKGVDTGKYVMRNCGKLFDSVNSYPNTVAAHNDSLQIPVEYCNIKMMLSIVLILKKYFKDK